MFHKSFFILGIVLLIIEVGLVTLVVANPFFILVSPLDILLVVISIIVALSGFIEVRSLRITLAALGTLVWTIVFFFIHIYSPPLIHQLLQG
ncbi:MAG: hypothetical protein Q7S27_04090 [Nanoarchaeota archaeon]|nr:hypothetical protein [Nanoarchaeota archaeon]